MEDISDAPSHANPLSLSLDDLLKTLPLHTRLMLRAEWFIDGIVTKFPGYSTFARLRYRVRRQGLSGLFEPPFNITKQDFSIYDKHLRWHGWGVLREEGGFRPYTPTKRTSGTFLSLTDAWRTLEDAYWGRPYGDWVSLVSLGNRKDGSSPKNKGDR